MSNSRMHRDPGRPYYLFVPADQETSFSACVLHYLCHALNLEGCEAYVTSTSDDHSRLKTPVLTDQIKDRHRQEGLDPIAIYSGATGNPLDAAVCVRYILDKASLPPEKSIGAQSADLVFYYAKRLQPSKAGGGSTNLLGLPFIDPEVFKPDPKRAKDKTYLYQDQSSPEKIDLSRFPSGMEVLSPANSVSQQELALVLQAGRILYADKLSVICIQAMLCGCPVIYMNEGGSDTLPLVDLLENAGSALMSKKDGVKHATESVGRIRKIWARLEADFWKQLQVFIAKTQDAARIAGATNIMAPDTRRPVPSAPAGPKKRMLVFSSESPLSPCPQIRLLRPFAYLKEEWELIWAIQDGKLQIGEIGSVDMILMHRYTPGQLSIANLAAIFNRGKPVIYETDDLLNEMPEYHPQGGAAWKEGIEYTVRHAAAVVVSTRYLADKYRPLNPAIHILPNYVDFDAFFSPVPQQADMITIGLLGTSIQSPNFDLVDAALRALCDKYRSRVKIYFVGWETPKGWANHPNAEFVPVIVEYENYAARLRQMQWTIALVPLAADDFNRSKSAIKWLEYSAAGIATVFSDVPIYSDVVTHGETGLLAADSAAAWTDAMTALIEDKDYRHRIASAAQSAVRSNYALKDKAALYGQTYGEIAASIKTVPNTAAATPVVTSSATSTIAPTPDAPPEKLTILVYSLDPKESPCSQIRLFRPFQLLNEKWNFIWAWDELNRGSLAGRADVVVLHRTIVARMPRESLDLLLHCGKPVIYESDDLLNEIPDYHRDTVLPVKEAIEYAIKHAHAVVVSSQYLADKYRLMNPAVHVLPNFVDYTLFHRPVPLVRDTITIGLLGTSIQEPNFALVEQALRKLSEKYGARLRIHIWGFEAPKGWTIHPNMLFIPVNYDYASYAHQLAALDWDIALVPLVEDAFNLSKSPIKWLEYSSLGIASIFSDIAVYRDVVEHGRTGLLVPDSQLDAPEAWLEAITSLIEDGDKRRSIARAAQDEVREKFDINRNADRYDRCYRDITIAARKSLAAKAAANGAAAPLAAPDRRRMVVYSIDPKNSPCSQIRWLRPFQLLQNQWEFHWPMNELKQGSMAPLQFADIVVLHRTIVAELPQSELDAVLDCGKPVIYESDDLLNEIPQYHRDKHIPQKEAIEYTIRRAHAVVVSSQYLADKYRLLNPEVHVLPNYVDYKLFYRPVPPADDTITIGMLGTSIQGPNFALVDQALRALCTKYGARLRIHIWGFHPPAGWESHPNMHFISVNYHYESYARQLASLNWDIALIPLAEDDFNLSKSPIKWLEYSSVGIASIFSDIAVYRDVVEHDRTGLLVPDSPEAWAKAIASLIEDGDKRRKIAQAAQDEVRDKFDINRNVDQYNRCYQALTDTITKRIADKALPAPIPAPAAAPAAAPASASAPTFLPSAQSAKKRLVVLSIESTWSPCPQIRFILPFTFLEDQWELVWGIQGGQINFPEMQRADLIVLHRFTPGLFPLNDLQTIFNMGKPMVYETDDLLNDIPDYHPQAADSKKWKAGIEFAVKNSRAVVVSTPFLADKYRAMNPHIHILPNYLDFDRFYRRVPDGQSDQITIGLLGTSIQGPNFALVEAALRTVCERYPGKINIYFMGWKLPAGWENHPAVQFLPFVHEYRTYAERLLEMQWDIALVPLIDDDFNHSKSAIKWLEYAAAGIAPVFSDVSVYRDVVHQGRTGLLVPDAPDAWLAALTSLIDNPTLRRQIARTAQAEVRKHYSLSDKAALYGQVYRNLAGGGKPAPASEPAPTDPAVRGILLLDTDGDAVRVNSSLRSLVDAKLENLVAIVLTAKEGAVPEWTDTLRYVQVHPDEFAAGVEQLSNHPDFDWVAIMEAGAALTAE
jgi:glycosyltransferase involved in cell wall biosynthesis